MKIKLISVGKINSDPAAPLSADYISRIRKFIPFEDIVLKTDKDDKIAARMIKESQKGQILAALDERGRLFDSFEFSSLISKWMNAGHTQVTMVIGGADGLPQEIKQKAHTTIALSKMTLPHRLARLILAEQIYRGLCIIKNVPYQK